MRILVRNNGGIISLVNFHRLKRLQQGLLNIVAKLGNPGCCYEVLRGLIIQQHTGRQSTKRDMQLQQLMNIRQQNIWSRNLG